ncbi:MAG: PAS domain S-box protein [Chloroflexota bacterium]
MKKRTPAKRNDKERIINLNSVLKALRNVNQLIVQEKDRERLIQKSCDLMVETRGFLCAWILLFDKNRKYLSAAVSGGKEMGNFLQQLEQGSYPQCIDRLLAHRDSFGVCDDILQEENACLPKSHYNSGKGLISRLQYRRKVYGVVAVYVPSDYALDPEEQSLFKELAGDVAFALYNIEEDEKHQLTEKELQQSEEKLRLMFQSLTVGAVLSDTNGKITQVNEAKVCMHGYDSKEELIGRSLLDLIAASDRIRIEDNMKDRVAGGLIKSAEYSLLKKDGTEFLAEVNNAVLRDQSGNPIGFIGISHDITERKRIEGALKESEALYSNVVNRSGDGIQIIQDDILKFANPKLLEITGFSLDEMVGKPGLDFVAPEWRKFIQDRYNRRMAGETLTPTYEIELVSKYGRKIPVEGTASLVEYGGKPADMSIVRDITERKGMEDALKQSEEKLRLMFESMTDGVTITNLEGTILEANEAKVRMHGYDSKAELIGRPVFSLSVNKDRSRIEQDRRQAFKEGYAKNIECTFLTKDGREFPGEVSIAAFKDASGKPVGTVSITRDISERRQREEQLIITDRLASIGELSSGIAHELNNPLTSIIGFSQLLLEKDVPDNLKEDLTTINKEAQRTAHIVRNLLTFARKHEPKKQPVDINDTIQKVLEMRAYEHKINNIKVNTRFLAELPEVKADGFQLQQVFLNIIINAEYFMIEAHGRGNLNIITERAGDFIRASLADDGPGISVENMSRIFNPFFTTKEVGKGTGLGLSICHGIVTAHGGRIYTESEPGKGAAFIVELPIHD